MEQKCVTVECTIYTLLIVSLQKVEILGCLLFFIQDSRTVVDRYKTGFYPPSDVQFEDLSAPGASQSTNGGSRVDGAVRAGPGNVGGKGAKRPGIGAIFGQKKVFVVANISLQFCMNSQQNDEKIKWFGLE